MKRKGKEVPRWRRGKTAQPAPQVIQLRGRDARDYLRGLKDREAEREGRERNGAAPVNDALARTGAWKRRRQMPPVLWGAGVAVLGAVLRSTPNPALFSILGGIATAILLIGFTRHASAFARRWADAAALLALAWVPALAISGFGAPAPALLALTWIICAGTWWKHYAIRPEEGRQEPGPAVSSDAAIWARLADKRRWSAWLTSPQVIPGGVKYQIEMDGVDTHIGNIMSEPRAIAAAYGKAQTEAYAEPDPAGIESRGVFTRLKSGTLQESQAWDGRGFSEQGIARIGRFADSAPVRIRILVPRDGARHGLVAGASGAGKALALDTPVPTPDGWTTMGELADGDLVYGDDGKPCRVIRAWPVRHGRPCYEVAFSDGSKIVADAEHLWLAETQRSRMSASNARRKPGGGSKPERRFATSDPVVLSTEEMARTLRTSSGHLNYSVRVAEPLEGANAELPVPPYTLGAWLGDGHTNSGSITSADPEIIAEITGELRDDAAAELANWPPVVNVPMAGIPFGLTRAAAYELAGRGDFPVRVTRVGSQDTPGQMVVLTEDLVREIREGDSWRAAWAVPSMVRATCASYRIRGLTERLLSVEVLGSKHIPIAYMRASEQQRRALLAGLLDTDGTCTKQGSVEFCNTNERLARDVLHLVSTLGYKATITGKTARLYGKDCGNAWTVRFTPGDKVFRLQRKIARQVTTTRATSDQRYVTGIRPVPSLPVRCITVDSPNHLYLVGESCIPTHNTELLNLLVWLALTSEIPVVPVILDPQNGQSLPQWKGKVLYAAGLEECVRMRRALNAGLMDRSRRLASMTWDDDGNRAKGMPFFDARLSGLPVVMPITDEAPLLLAGGGNSKLSDEMISKSAEAGKLGRKAGESEWFVAQVPSLGELGDQALRSMLVGGNVACLRTGDKVSAGMLGLQADPSALPRYFTDGSPTQGIGYAVTMDNRQAPMRTDLVPSRMRHQAVTVPQLEDDFLEAMDRAMRGGGVPLPAAPAAPVSEAPAEDGPEGRRCTDAVLQVLADRSAPMERGEIIKWAGELVTTGWGREKPFSIRSVGDALRGLTESGSVVKVRDGVYQAAGKPETITDSGRRSS